jgi:uncharacterized surface protein with fasciclin (FAS1) repeats
MESSNKVGLAIATLVIGVLVGGGIGYAAGNGKNDDSSAAKPASASMAKSDTSDSDGVLVGGAKMVRTKDIVDNAAAAKNVTTVVAAVKAAGLVDTLKSPGPFTVFAPNNGAFDKLPAGTVDTLVKPESKATLTKILTLHVVSGTYTSADLTVMAGKGETLTTVEGEMLTPVMENNQLSIKDPKGNIVSIETADVISSNGVTHVINNVLMPAN